MPPRPRPRRRPVQRTATATARQRENNENENENKNENLPVVPAPATDADVSFDVYMDAIVPRTSTPARLPLRQASKPTQTRAQRALLSSLPPSSPVPVFPTSSHERLREGRLAEFGLGGDDGGPAPAPAASASPAPTRDDPFGFFAAERRLKERTRSSRLDAQSRPRAAPKLHEVEEASDILPESDGVPAFATPPAPATQIQPLDASDLEIDLDISTFASLSGIHTPPGHTPSPRPVSPHHRRPKRKDIPPSSTASSRSSSPSFDLSRRMDDGELVLASLPQTPSPVKRLSSSVPRRPFGDIAHAPRVNSPLKKAAATKDKKAKKDGKTGSGPPRKKPKTDETLAEEVLRGMAEELEERLPRRPTRRTTRQAGIYEEPPKAAPRKTAAAAATKRKGKKAQAAKPKSKPRSKKAAKRGGDGEEGESFVLSGDEREQFEHGREKRREHFRQVDDYVLAEESVYVI